MTDPATSDDMLLAEIIKIAPLVEIAEATLIPNKGVRIMFENGDVLKTYLRSLHQILSKPPTDKSQFNAWKKIRCSILSRALVYQKKRQAVRGIT